MFARVVHASGPTEGIEHGVDVYREHVLPYVRDVSGFRGLVILLDRDRGRSLAITLWATENAMNAYEATGQRFRELLAEASSAEVGELESYEVALLELSC